MRLTSIKKFAAVSAVALSVAYASGVIAAPIQIGDPVVVPINATVENTIDVTVTNPIRFGTIGSMGDDTDTATLTLDPDDTMVDDPGDGFLSADPASIVSSPAAPGAAADITVTGAFNSTTLYVTYDACVDLQVGGAGREFVVSNIRDNLDAPSVGTGILAGAYDCSIGGVRVAGEASTTVAGLLTFQIGADITTDTTAAAAYPDGAYTGSVTMYLSY